MSITKKKSALAVNLRKILTKEGITVAMLSEWSGVPRRTIESWIAGREPGAEKLMRVAQVLRRPMDDFFKEEGHVGDEKY